MANPWDVVSVTPRNADPWAVVSVKPFSNAMPENDPLADPGYSAGDYGKGFAGGVNRGLINVLGSPVDFINQSMSVTEQDRQSFLDSLSEKTGIDFGKAPKVSGDAPVGGKEWLSYLANKLKLLPEAPDTSGGRILNRAGEIIGESAPAAAGILGAAGRLSPLTKAPSLSETMLRPIAATPGKAAVGELAATVGSGLGSGAVNEIIPNNQYADIVGQLIGGMTPTVMANMPASLVAKGVQTGRKYFSTAAVNSRAQDEVRKVLGKELNPAVEANLTQSARLQQEIPGFKPTIAESTGSPGLLAAQTDIESRMSGGALDEAVRRRQGMESAVNQYAQKMTPESEFAPEFVVTEAGKKIEDLTGRIEAGQADMQGARKSLAGSLPVADRFGLGERIRDAVKNARTATQADMSRVAQELGIHDTDITAPFKEAAQKIVQELRPEGKFVDLKNQPEIMATLKKIAGTTKGGAKEYFVTFADLKSLRERVSDDLIDAVGASTPSNQKIRTLTRLKGMVDDVIDDVIAQSDDPDLSARYKEFRDIYRKEYVERFEKGVALKVRLKDGRGFYRTPDEKVAESFFGPDKISEAKQYKAIFGADPDAIKNIENAALDSLRESAFVDGVLDPRKLQLWAKNHRTVLDEFPNIKSWADDIQSTNDRLLKRIGDLDARRQVVDRQILTKEINKLKGGGKTIDQFLNGALVNENKMSQLVNRLRGNTDAMETLRREVWTKASAGQSAKDVMSFLTKHRKSLSKVLTKQHLDALENIANAKMIMERSPTPSGKAEVPRPFQELEKSTGMTLPTIINRYYAVQSGRVQKAWLFAESALKGLTARKQAAMDDMWKQALYDQNIAMDMAKAVSNPNVSAPLIAKRLNSRFYALGLVPESKPEEEIPIEELLD